ncbi:MAG: phytanoyl-CoA dioxygenase family protein [Caulobacter sp.]|nr:phytanoyl-CoA dioxygenase family protein [Caulobacter sp.]
MRAADLSIARDGAALFPAALAADEIARLGERLEQVIDGRPGRRLPDETSAGHLLAPDGAIGRIAASLISGAARPVRAVIFDKSPASNWIVAWHQDRTICVRNRVEVEGFGPWSTKDGLLHVAPPIAVLEGMVTLRLHLDDCDDDNAPLRIALGSHQLGYVSAAEAASRVEALPAFVCHARAGDVWAYSTPILHMSERSRSYGRRRVLQVDYAARTLPGGLEWRGLD